MATGSRLKVGLGWDLGRYGIQYAVFSIQYTLAGVAHSGEWKTKLEAGQRARGWPSEGVVEGFWGWVGHRVSATAAATVCYGGAVAMTPLIDFTWRPRRGKGRVGKGEAARQMASGKSHQATAMNHVRVCRCVCVCMARCVCALRV